MEEKEIVQNQPQEVIENGGQEDAQQEANAEQENADVRQEDAQERLLDKDDKIPLATFLEEKKKRKEIENELRKFKERESQLEIKKRYVEAGWPEESAEHQANLEYKVMQLTEKQTNAEYDNEIYDLAKSSDFYSDAVNYKKEIRDAMKERKLTAQEAYLILRGTSRNRELKQDEEQRTLYKRREEAAPRTVPNATASAPKNPYPLDSEDKKALEGLQKAQPNGNWTAEKYFKLMKQ